MSELTHIRLLEVLDYDPETGHFAWKLPHLNRVGKLAGSTHSTGYRFVTVDGVRYAASRLAWFYVNGVWPHRLGFKNEDSADCRIGNLAELPRGNYQHNHGTRDGRAGYHRAYRQRNRAQQENIRFKHRFGISLDEYKRLLVAQNGVCAICERPETATHRGKPRQLAVDHDHVTDLVRALLCFDCNTGIGKFGDNAETLLRAAAYLQRHARPGNVVPLNKESA